MRIMELAKTSRVTAENILTETLNCDAKNDITLQKGSYSGNVHPFIVMSHNGSDDR